MDVFPDTPSEPDYLPDYRDSRWLRYGAGPSFYGDPPTPALFTEALTFLDSITGQFDEFGPWPPMLPADLLEALHQHNQRAQAEGRLGESEEVTLIHVLTLSRRRLQAFEETGWNLTHYEDLVRFVDGTITQTLAGMMSENNPTLTAAILLASLPPEDLVEEDDPDYASFEANSGCRTCTGGQPCQVRIDQDIHDILSAAHLPVTEKLACLQWMLDERCSTLTRSITDMAQAFASERASNTLSLALSQAGMADANLRQDAASQGKDQPALG